MRQHRVACLERGCETCRAIIRRVEETRPLSSSRPDGRFGRDEQHREILRACAVAFRPRIDWPETFGETRSLLVGELFSLRVCRNYGSSGGGYSWCLQDIWPRWPYPAGYPGGTVGEASTRENVSIDVREELPLILGRSLELYGVLVADATRTKAADADLLLERLQERLGTISFLLDKAGPAARWLAQEVADIQAEMRRKSRRGNGRAGASP